MQTTSCLYSLKYDDAKTYLVASLFIIGNVMLPQLCHVLPNGGMIWLPIYFFTLIGAYKYGWRVGLIIAIASPLVNSVLFGMPAAAALPSIVLKSTLLAFFAGIIAAKFRKASLIMLLSTVAGYQITGTFGEWFIKGDLYAALQDFRMGVPGMLLQVFGGWLVINKLINKKA